MRGRWEALITIPAATTFTVDDGGGADTVTIPAATYYATALLAAVETAIETAVGSGFTITASFAEGGTGLVTVAKNAGTFKLLFPSDSLAQLFGVATAAAWNGSPAASFTGTRGMQGVFLSSCDVMGPDLDFSMTGHSITDAVHTKGPSGAVRRLVANEYFQFSKVYFAALDRDHALNGVNSAVVSWQQFLRETQLGANPWFVISNSGAAPTVKIYYDATNNTLLGSAAGGDGIYSLVFEPELAPQQVTEGWTGLWRTTPIDLVKV